MENKHGRRDGRQKCRTEPKGGDPVERRGDISQEESCDLLGRAREEERTCTGGGVEQW